MLSLFEEIAKVPGTLTPGAPTAGVPARRLRPFSFPPAVTSLVSLCLTTVLAIPAVRASAAAAKARFHASEIESRGAEVLFCDLDGDRLKDLLVLERTNVAVFYQDRDHGFSKEPDHRYSLNATPTLLWSAQLGPGPESVLLLTSEGVSRLSLASRTGPSALEPILRQQTILPVHLDEPSTTLLHLPLSVKTGTDWPLLLVPTERGLQVWQHSQGWQLAQTLDSAPESEIRPIVGSQPGYRRWDGLSLGLGDLNGDGREDLMLKRHSGFGMETYLVYVQRTNGLFDVRPTATHQNKSDWRSWLGWVDLNRDGQIDLIKSTWLYEPWFVPGIRSGKVVVGIYSANPQGQLPGKPQQVFRKNDWTAALPVLDLDGDGFPDLVLGYSLFDTREGARKMITAKQLDFSLRFHFYRPGIGFPKEPDCQRDLILHLDQHSLMLGWDRRQAFERFVDLSGDFNADGKRDLLVRDHSDHVSVYLFLSPHQGFSRAPDFRFSCPEPIERLQTQDLNHDGISDLAIKLQDRNTFRIFLSDRK